MAKRMDLHTLKAILSNQKSDALAAQSAAKLSQDRADAMDYYLGDMSKDMPVPEGRSKAVSTDVADTIEGLMPSLMEIFAGGDEVVRFEPVGPEDVEAAEQETDYVNYVFMQQNPGFLVLYSFIKDALLSKVGVVKVYAEDYEDYESSSYHDQSEDVFGMVAGDPECQLVAATPKPQPDGSVLYDFTVEKVVSRTKVCVESVPPEEFGIAREARSIRMADYVFHKTTKPAYELIEQGFDADVIDRLPAYDGIDDSEEQARDTVDEGSLSTTEALDKAMRRIEVYEHYARIDYEGTGKAKLWKITTASDEDTILTKGGQPDIEEVNCIPFAAMTPVIMTHRFFGRSVADLVMDIQRIKTAILRGILDNVYLSNHPRTEVSEATSTDSTIDDLLVSRPGGIVRTKTPGGINPLVVPNIAGSAFPIMEYLDATREWRTGVTRQGQGIDAKALQNQSATAVNQVYTAAQARMKLIARIFAETGIKDMFVLLHQTIRKHGGQPQTVRLRNKWTAVDPRAWKSRQDLTVNVGLGTGSKPERIQAIMMLIGLQREALANRLFNLVDYSHLYNSVKELTKLLDYKNPDLFVSDPAGKPPPQPEPDAKVEEAKARVQIEAQRAQIQAQIDQQRVQSDMVANQAKLEQDIVLQREKLAAEIQLKREQMAAEMALKRDEMMLEAQLKRELGAMNVQMSAAVANVQQGGEVG